MIPIAALVLLAAAQPASGAPAPQGPPQDVPGVTVTAKRIQHTDTVTVTAPQACPDPEPARYPASADPQVIDSYPRQDATVSPGLVQVRVSFDAPMSCYAEVRSEGGDRDPCEPLGIWTVPNRRSFLLRCRLQPDAAYTFSFRRDHGQGFMGLSGRDAEPFVLHFATTDAEPTDDWTQALAADPGPPNGVNTRGYVTCADVRGSAASEECRRQRFGAPTPP